MNDERNQCLQHHGVLGQKWGVRRYLRKNGTLTQLGKRRLQRDVVNDVSGKEAVTLKAGTKTYRISPDKKGDLDKSDRMYSNNNIKELSPYIKEMTDTARLQENGKAYLQTYVLKNNLKIPSEKTQTTIEKKLLKNPKIVSEIQKSTYTGDKFWNEHCNDEQRLRLLRQSMGDQNNASILRDTFSKELQRRGYMAYRDSYDKGVEFIRSNNSIIIMDQNNNLCLTKSKRINKKMYVNAFIEYNIQKDKVMHPHKYDKSHDKYDDKYEKKQRKIFRKSGESSWKYS